MSGGDRASLLERAYHTLNRVADVEADLRDRQRREALGLLPELHVSPPPAPSSRQAGDDADEIDGEAQVSFRLFEGVLMEVIYSLRCEFGQELAALRDEVQALKKRRRRKGKATATTATEDRNDDHASGI